MGAGKAARMRDSVAGPMRPWEENGRLDVPRIGWAIWDMIRGQCYTGVAC